MGVSVAVAAMDASGDGASVTRVAGTGTCAVSTDMRGGVEAAGNRTTCVARESNSADATT